MSRCNDIKIHSFNSTSNQGPPTSVSPWHPHSWFHPPHRPRITRTQHRLQYYRANKRLTCGAHLVRERKRMIHVIRESWKKSVASFVKKNIRGVACESTTRPVCLSHSCIVEPVTCEKALYISIGTRGGGLGSRPKKMYGERLGDGVEYHLMSPTPRR